jgi:hypothetical protein
LLLLLLLFFSILFGMFLETSRRCSLFTPSCHDTVLYCTQEWIFQVLFFWWGIVCFVLFCTKTNGFLYSVCTVEITWWATTTRCSIFCCFLSNSLFRYDIRRYYITCLGATWF